jgi:hypothetical protein
MLKDVTVVGAPGIAITDYQQITGGGQTHYHKGTEGMATAIENLVIHVEGKHDIKSAKNFKTINKALEFGKSRKKNVEFLNFYAKLVKTLSGKADLKYIDRLLDKAQEGLKAHPDDRSAWPKFMEGWFSSMEKRFRKALENHLTRVPDESEVNEMFLKFVTRPSLDQAKTGLALIKNKKESLISLKNTKLPLMGLTKGSTKSKPMGYNELFQD